MPAGNYAVYNLTVSGNTITTTGGGITGTDLQNCTLADNRITHTGAAAETTVGILLHGSSGNLIEKNTCTALHNGLKCMDASHSNELRSNTVTNSRSSAVCIVDSNGVEVTENAIRTGATNGIFMQRSKKARLLRNTIQAMGHNDYPPEQILSRSFFDENPAEFYRFYRSKMLCPHAKPNAAHYKLAELEQAGKCTAVVTQNIDGLHQAAGSRTVYELHGSVLRNHCMRCGRAYGVEAVVEAAGIPRCTCGGIIKPDVVLYEEGLNQQTVEGAVHAIARADCLIVAGTSLSVYPAAGFIRYFQGDHFVLINRDPTPADKLADLVLHQKVGQVLSQIQVR